MLYIIYQEDVENSAPLRERHKLAHFRYLEDHDDKLVLGGALLADDGVARVGSVLIINVANREEAEEFSAYEPLRKGGVFKSVKITHMRRGQWNPDAAPKTPEGN
ncbi:MAG: YciI family protein [Rhodospirillales bacterium]|jgi:hypothetical protein|nr:YciI family protein [Rhodospirillales bacterium]|tara:strand:+ start:64 stop:378 length:315 start_codon:yes stop_codon:yes gene_type:complete